MGKLTMNSEEIYKFFENSGLCYVGTLTNSGHPHVTPIWCYYDGSHFYMTLMDGNPKSRSIKRDRRISIAASSSTMPYKGISIHGRAELVHENVRYTVKKIANKYAGEEKAEEMTAMLMKNPQVIVKVKPERIYSWDQSKGSFDDVAEAEKSGSDLRSL